MEDIKKQIADILKERRESAFENAQRDYETARGDKDFARLDTQVRELTLEISFARSQGKTNKAADKKLKELESERGKWLEAHGLSITPRFICPVCGRPTQYRVRPDSQARNWPIWCKHCRQESIVNIEVPEPASKETSA